MGAVIEDIAGRSVDGDCPSFGGRVWLLSIQKGQERSVVVLDGMNRHETPYPACNCNVSNFCCGGSEAILAGGGVGDGGEEVESRTGAGHIGARSKHSGVKMKMDMLLPHNGIASSGPAQIPTRALVSGDGVIVLGWQRRGTIALA